MQSRNSSSPLISVMMPTYNRLVYLQQAVASIQAQTLGDFEVLIYNDASTDGTSAWLKELQEKDSRVRVIEAPENSGGCFKGRQVLLEEARGKYLALMDDDDLSLPERFEKQVQFLEGNPDVAVLGCETLKFKGEPPREKTFARKSPAKTHARLVASLLFTLPFTHSTTMFRRSLITGHTYPSSRTREDAMFFWSLFRAGKQFACLPDVLLLYRMHPHNSCNVQSTDPDWNTHVGMVWRDLGLGESLIDHYRGLTVASYPRLDLWTCRGAQREAVLKRSILQLFSLYKVLVAANGKSRVLDPAVLERLLAERWEQHCRIYAKWIPTLSIYTGLWRRGSWYSHSLSAFSALPAFFRILARNLFRRRSP